MGLSVHSHCWLPAMLSTSLRSHLLPTGEQHESRMMKAILPAQNGKLCFWPHFPKMFAVNGKKEGCIIRIHLGKVWHLNLPSHPEISISIQFSPDKPVV